ncbi:hypothetical protein ACHAXS_009744 [Conticribra weissflogii]
MLSPTDPLFTLHISNELDKTQAIPTRNSIGFKKISGGSSVTGVCFVREPFCRRDGGWRRRSERRTSGSSASNGDDSDDGSSSSCSSSSLQFRCSNLLIANSVKHQKNDFTSFYGAIHVSAGSNSSLSGGILASCHLDGTAKLWDLSTRRCIVRDICHENRIGAGLALRRVGNDSSVNGFEDSRHQFLYQTRDPMGTVTLHDLNRPETKIVELHTHSTTFCAMAPCQGRFVNNFGIGHSQSSASSEAQHLVALPNESQSTAEVRDLRINPGKSPAWKVTIGEDYKGWQGYSAKSRYYGMVTSLALCLQEPSQRIVLGCGMEDGSIFFHDLGGIGRGREPWWIGHGKETTIVNNDYPGQNTKLQSDKFDGMTHAESRFVCRAKVAKDPVLCLDLISSRCKRQANNYETATNMASLLAVSGCAGDADAMAELPNQDQGTITTIKVDLANENLSDHRGPEEMKANIRKRTQTCSLSSGGRVGVSTCRFRPDGRIFGVGGWDHRLRIFGRTSSKPLAVLHGHDENVVALDWAPNSAVSGLVATGAADGRICVYRIFPHSLREI